VYPRVLCARINWMGQEQVITAISIVICAVVIIMDLTLSNRLLLNAFSNSECMASNN
jgi:hypothetical protein